MRMFSRYLLLASFGGMTVVSPAWALVTLGHGRIVGNASARVDYDSNIFLNNREESDTYATVNTGVRYVRDSGVVTLDAGASLSLLGFLDHTEQNAADPSFDAQLGYTPSDKTKLKLDGSFRRNSIANDVVNDRTTSNDTSLGANLQHLTTEKLGLRLITTYNKSDYRTAGYSDIHSYSFGVHGVHIYSPKLTLLAGFTSIESWTTRSVNTRRNPSTTDSRFTVGAEGEIAPKVLGDVSVGVVKREANKTGFQDEDALYLSARLSWAASEKTSWGLLASHDVSLSAADQSVKTFRLAVSVTQQLSEKMSLESSVGFEHMDQVGVALLGPISSNDREDDAYTIRSRLSYVLTPSATFDVSAGFRDNDSNLVFSTYQRFNLGAGITVRF